MRNTTITRVDEETDSDQHATQKLTGDLDIIASVEYVHGT